MNSDQIHIPYIDDLLVTWYDVPGAHFIKKVNHFDTALLLLSSYAIHLDETEHWFEVNFLKKFYTKVFNKPLADDAVQFVQLNLTANLDVDKLCKELKEVATDKVLNQLLYYFFDLTVSDGKLHDKELTFIETMRIRFGINQKDYEAIFSLYAMYNPSFRKERLQQTDEKLHLAFKVFGLSSGASLERVKDKYKELVKQHHPDKVTHLGGKHAIKATEMLKQINDAYSYIEKYFKR